MGKGSGEPATQLRAAIVAVRDCADTMETQAAGLLQALPNVPMDEAVGATAIELGTAIRDTSGRVTFELALLQAEIGEGKADTATVMERLSAMDALMMRTVAALADVVDRLEKSAERDEQYERGFVLVIEAMGVMLQGVEKAKAATQALGVMVPVVPARQSASPPVRLAADGSVVIVEVGAEGGSVTLIGRRGVGSEWQFARITDDQSEALFGEADVPITAPDLTSLAWVGGWEAGLTLMDRYPWARLSAQYVHPEFVERVRVAVEERLAGEPGQSAEYAREKWEWVFDRGGQGL